VAITDIDVLWLRDPTPFYKRYADADILTSSDELKTSVGKEEVLEKYPEAGAAFNIGRYTHLSAHIVIPNIGGYIKSLLSMLNG
jgi:hypothetical protein